MENNAELRKQIFYIYLKFRRHYGGNPNYTMLYGQREIALLDNFVKILEKNYELKSLGGLFFLDYFYFHFDFWFERDTTINNGGVPFLNWCVGIKGFSRWNNRSKSWKYFARKKLGELPNDLVVALNTKSTITKKVDKRQSSIKMMANFKSKNFLKLNEFEENDKERFYNTVEGYLNCLNFTTLYNRKSVKCVKCKFSKKCKKTLMKEFPEIAKIRGIE